MGLFPASKAEVVQDRQRIAQLANENSQLNSSLTALEIRFDNMAAASMGATGATGPTGMPMLQSYSMTIRE